MFYDVLKRIGFLAEQLQNNEYLLNSSHYEKIDNALNLLCKIERVHSTRGLAGIIEIVDGLTWHDDCETKCKSFIYEINGAKELLASVCADIEHDPAYKVGPC